MISGQVLVIRRRTWAGASNRAEQLGCTTGNASSAACDHLLPAAHCDVVRLARGPVREIHRLEYLAPSKAKTIVPNPGTHVRSNCEPSRASTRNQPPGMFEVGRRGCLDGHLGTRHGMHKSQPGCMQGLSLQVQLRPAAIKCIAHQRVPRPGQMHANLVGSTGVERAFQCTEAIAGELHGNVSARRLALLQGGHAHPHAWVAANADDDAEGLLLHRAMRHGQVFSMYAAFTDGTYQSGVGGQRLGDHEQPRSVLVQPVHDAGARQGRRTAMMRQQGVEQGAGPVARCRVHHPARVFVDHHQVLVFVNDGDGQRLGSESLAFGRGSQVELDVLPGPELGRCGGADLAIDLHVAGRDQTLEVVARELGCETDHGLVQALSVQAIAHDRKTPLRLSGLQGFVELRSLECLRRRTRFAHDPNPIITPVFSKAMTTRSMMQAHMYGPGRTLLRGSAWCAGLALLALAAACGTSPKDETAAWNVEKLYAEAKQEAENGAYDRAGKLFERLEGRAAGTILAQQAQLERAYVLQKSGEKAQALAVLERFIKLHPTSPAMDYALYLQGIVNFNDNLGIFGNLSQQKLSERDQQASRDSYQSFRQLVDQFPQSNYAEDARARMAFIVNSLAEYEVHVARYYYRRGAYVAAANRAQQAVREFQGSAAVEEALGILVQSYARLGLTQLRDDAERVLRKNYPESRFGS